VEGLEEREEGGALLGEEIEDIDPAGGLHGAKCSGTAAKRLEADPFTRRRTASHGNP
jgi:hypothetical protein